METPKTLLTPLDIAQMIDISAVHTDSTDDKIREVISFARTFSCYLVTILPAQTLRVKNILGDQKTPKVGGNVGFPSGGQTTHIKIKETRELLSMGVDEIDMVIDVAAHLSGRYDDVYKDIVAVVEASEGKPVKVILECYYLNEAQIRTGCDLAIKAGAAYIKTGTGWTPTGATVENVALIKSHVGDAINIKASGGIRGLESLLSLYRLGARRFGISSASAAKILQSLENRGQPVLFK